GVREEALERDQETVLAEGSGHHPLPALAVGGGLLRVGAGESDDLLPRRLRGEAADEHVEVTAFHRAHQLALDTRRPLDARIEFLREIGDEVDFAARDPPVVVDLGPRRVLRHAHTQCTAGDAVEAPVGVAGDRPTACGRRRENARCDDPRQESSAASAPGSSGHGVSTTLAAPSSFFWNISYARGASARGRRCVAKSSTPSGSSSVSSGRTRGTQCCKLAWPIFNVICLSNSVSIGSGSALPPYTPESEMVPPRRTMSIAE